MKVIIAAAGTGGHINPGIAIANKIKKEEPNSEIIFIGTKRGLENDLVPRAGYELKTVEAYGLNKKITLQNIRNNIKTVKGIFQARKIIKQFKPDIVIGTGGYICASAVLAAKKYKIPAILHESNANPGKAVKMLAKKVDTIMLGFKEAKSRIPKAKNIILTGTPTKIKKIEYSKQKRDEIIKKIGLKGDIPIILVFGGSQGAKAINDTILKIINEKINKNYQIIWSTGPIQYDIVKQKVNQKELENVKILPYIYNMEEIMNISDLIIARSGAMTITEIAVIGKPAIFIPLPYVSQNHQEYNARVLKDIGAAKLILNKELTAQKLNIEVQNIINNKEKLKKMGENAQKIAILDVEDRIYKEIKKIVK